MRTLPLLLVLAACAGEEPADTDPGEDPTTPVPAGAQVVSLEARDGVLLEADLYTGAAGSPGVVLLHMTPSGGWDRTSWPASFIDGLTAEGWSVVALDRRGAGGSAGLPQDAYEGEKGKYDVEAAVGALVEAGAGSIAVIGASNGTTSMIDYAVWAPGEGLPEVAALGFMTGGTYTENQTAMEVVPQVPALFTYSTAESGWSVAQQPLDPGSWRFEEYAGGDHGTKMFDAKPEVADDLLDFLRSAL